jgi:hypothetical protein
MARKRREVWQHRFNLNRGSVLERRLHDKLEALSEEGRATGWIIDTLLLQLEVESPEKHVLRLTEPQDEEAQEGGIEQVSESPVIKPVVPIVPHQNPNDILKARREAARRKLEGEQ